MVRMLLAETSWEEVEALRGQVTLLGQSTSIQAAGQRLAEIFARRFSSIVLARMFAVLPLSSLPEREQTRGRQAVSDDPRLAPETRVLSLLGTAGHDKTWNDRARSKGHLAVPLLDRAFVEGAPMIAKLLVDLGVDLGAIDTRLPIASRRMLGGNNGTFFVADAQSAVDSRGRRVIGAEDFVSRYAIRTVFGMGGAYLDGAIVVAIFFTNEVVDRLIVDRLPSLISNFKMATSKLAAEGRFFEPA
jgi:hypothetical protein